MLLKGWCSFVRLFSDKRIYFLFFFNTLGFLLKLILFFNSVLFFCQRIAPTKVSAAFVDFYQILSNSFFMKVYTKDSAADIRLFLSTSLPKTFLFSNVIVCPVCIRKQQVCLTFIRANSFNWQREHNVLLFVRVEYRFYRFLVVVILWGSSTRLLAVIKPKYATDKFFL